MELSRRGLLLAAAVLPGGCQFLASAASVDMGKVAEDVHTVAGAISAVERLLPATVTGLLEDLKAKAQAVTATISAVASQPLVVRIEDDLVGAFSALKASGLLPTNVSQVFSDGLALLGVVKSAIGIASLVALAPGEAEVEAVRQRLKAVAGQGRAGG